MLILTLKPLSNPRAEEIVIELPDGRSVRVRLVEVDRGKARLGIEADADIQIYRQERMTDEG